MTGFSRAEGATDVCAWAWEIKSVNGKGLDVRIRVPRGFDALENQCREWVNKLFKRGNIAVNLDLTWTAPQMTMVVNEEVLAQMIKAIATVQAAMPTAMPPRADSMLALRGVLEHIEAEPNPEDRQNLENMLSLSLNQALDQLVDGRDGEGQHLGAVLHDQLEDIETLCEQAGALASLQPDALAKRLTEQVEALVQDHASIDPDRLTQEAALLMIKADVREELDRLKAHIHAARDLLAESIPVGRRLDFLCQEFNREANTLCSKSSDTDLTRLGLDLKSVIEQFREQVQNIE